MKRRRSLHLYLVVQTQTLAMHLLSAYDILVACSILARTNCWDHYQS